MVELYKIYIFYMTRLFKSLSIKRLYEKLIHLLLCRFLRENKNANKINRLKVLSHISYSIFLVHLTHSVSEAATPLKTSTIIL